MMKSFNRNEGNNINCNDENHKMYSIEIRRIRNDKDIL